MLIICQKKANKIRLPKEPMANQMWCAGLCVSCRKIKENIVQGINLYTMKNDFLVQF